MRMNFFARSNFKKELVDFFKNVALMVKSGIPLNEAMVVLIQQSRSKSFNAFLLDIKTQLEHGSTLSKALESYKEDIGEMALNIIRAGEINGTLDVNLKYLADIMTHNKELKSKINAALLYPKIVLALTFFMGGGISIFVLPKLIPLFKSVDIELPLATKILLGISVFVRDSGIIALGGGNRFDRAIYSFRKNTRFPLDLSHHLCPHAIFRKTISQLPTLTFQSNFRYII